MRSRLIVYEGLTHMLQSGASAQVPTWAAQFEMWAHRAYARNQSIAHIYAEIQRRLSSGRSLAQSLSSFIPSEEAMIIEAGEASGRLMPTLQALTRSVEAGREMKAAVRSAYRDPMVALIGFIAVSLFSGFFVWPNMLDALPEKYWDAWSLPLINSQIFLTHHLWVLGILGLIYGAYRWSLPRWTGRARQLAEKLFPPYATYRDRQAAALLMVLSGLLRSGKTIDQALSHIAGQGTDYIRWHTRAMQRRLVLFAGDPARMLGTGIFSEAILDRLSNAAASRQLAQVVQHIGTDAIDDVVKTVKASATAGGYFLFVLVGALFAYYTAVQVIGAQSAADRLMREVKTGPPQMQQAK